jgi:hypothetical protein
VKESVFPLTRTSWVPTVRLVDPKVWLSPLKAMLSTAEPSARLKMRRVPPARRAGAASKVRLSSPSA